jgi:hypothetical protein
MTTQDEDCVSQSIGWALDSMIEDSRMSVEDSVPEWLQGKRDPSRSNDKKQAYKECIDVIQYLKSAKMDYIESKNEEKKSTMQQCIKEGYSDIAILYDYLNSMIKQRQEP